MTNRIMEIAKQAGFFIDVLSEPMRIGVFHQKIDKELKRFAELVRADTLDAEQAPVQESIGYVRMLNGEPTPDDDGCVFSYGENPYRDTYGDEEWLPVFTAPQAQQPATPADVPMLMVDEIRKVSDKADEGQESTEFMLAFARAIEQLVRQKASIK